MVLGSGFEPDLAAAMQRMRDERRVVTGHRTGPHPRAATSAPATRSARRYGRFSRSMTSDSKDPVGRRRRGPSMIPRRPAPPIMASRNVVVAESAASTNARR
jgi:hypothetical protein